MSTASLACPGCRASLKLPAAGGKVRCPRCGAVFDPAAAGSQAREEETYTARPEEATSGWEASRTPTSACLRPPQQPGELGRLGPYRVLKVLGQGGMGRVYQAEDTLLQRPVALKVLLPAYAGDSRARQRFLREARAAAALEHDNVVTIHQVGEDNGTPFLAMPLLKGESLEDRLKRDGKLPVPEVLRVGREVAEGLAAAHEHGLIHRDIKPGNLWLERGRDRVKVLDFGLARPAGGGDDSPVTEAGTILGTPAYMAPEQARGDEVDARADLFSLGCVLYRMLTGQPPFGGKDTMSVLMSLASHTPSPPAALDPAVPAALSALVMRLLSKDRGRRPASATAVADELAALAAAEKTGRLTRKEAVPLPKPHGKVGRRLTALAAGVGLLVLLPLGGWLAAVVLRAGTADRTRVAALSDGATDAPIKESKSAPTGPAGPALPDRRPAPAPPAGQVISAGNADKVTAGRDLPRDAYELVWMPGGRLALHGREQPVEVFDLTPFRPVRKIAEGKRLVHFAASTDGETVAFCENSRRVEVHNLRTGKSLFLDTKNDQPSLAFSPDGKLLATGGLGTQAMMWDVATGTRLRSLDAPCPGGLTPAFRPDGTLLAVGNRNDVTRLFEVETGRLVHTLPRTMSQELRFSPDGRRLAVGYVDGSVVLWDVARGERLVERKTGAEEVYTLDWSPAGDVLVTAGLRGKITLWDARGLSALKELAAPEQVICVRFSPDGSRLFSSGGRFLPSAERKITVWGLDTH